MIFLLDNLLQAVPAADPIVAILNWFTAVGVEKDCEPRRSLGCVGLLMLAASAAAVSAQGVGAIAGTVTDGIGAGLPGATSL